MVLILAIVLVMVLVLVLALVMVWPLASVMVLVFVMVLLLVLVLPSILWRRSRCPAPHGSIDLELKKAQIRLLIRKKLEAETVLAPILVMVLLSLLSLISWHLARCPPTHHAVDLDLEKVCNYDPAKRKIWPQKKSYRIHGDS